MHRFFVPAEQIKGKEIGITGSDVNHIKNVLRLKVSDTIEVFDSRSKVFEAKIKTQTKDRILCQITKEKKEATEPRIFVTLAQSLPKGKKLELIIQKACELGASRIIPFISERSVPKIEEVPSNRQENKLERWRKIAKEASQQSGRTKICEISPVMHFKEVLDLKKEHDLALIPWEGEKKITLKSILTTHRPNNLLVVIGPEGGFSKAEVQKAIKAGFLAVKLSDRILRTETAAISALSNIFFALD